MAYLTDSNHSVVVLISVGKIKVILTLESSIISLYVATTEGNDNENGSLPTLWVNLKLVIKIFFIKLKKNYKTALRISKNYNFVVHLLLVMYKNIMSQ